MKLKYILATLITFYFTTVVGWHFLLALAVMGIGSLQLMTLFEKEHI